MIRNKLVMAQERHKKYVNQRRHELEFDLGDKDLLKVAEKKGIIMRFGKKGNLSPRYTSPFEILERIDIVAYRLALSPQLSAIHNVFYVSMLQKYNPTLHMFWSMSLSRSKKIFLTKNF